MTLTVQIEINDTIFRLANCEDEQTMNKNIFHLSQKDSTSIHSPFHTLKSQTGADLN